MNRIDTELYQLQLARWPRSGRHILAQFDADSIIVYQAYRPSIGRFAAEHGYFGGDFGFDRMSWIKPNFLWMMYRSGWASKPDQEVVLAVRIRRSGFDEILRLAVPSSFDRVVYPDPGSWRTALQNSPVRLQWDPDHDPSGLRVERRAVQLGLRGGVLHQYGKDWVIDIQDISPFVHEQRAQFESGGCAALMTPTEHVYPLADARLATRLGLATYG